MSKQCALTRVPLHNLRGFFLLFTERAGVLRALRPYEKDELAQGVHFNCPKCTHDSAKAHGVTLLFDLQSVPPNANPPGRHNPQKFPCKLYELHLGEVKSLECDWHGWVVGGEVVWK